MQHASAEPQRKQHTPGIRGILHTSTVHRGPMLSRDSNSQHKHQIAAASQEAEVDVTKLLWLQEYESRGRGEG